MVRAARDILNQPAFAAFNAGELSPGPSVETDQEILDWVAKDAETALHPSCTARMGVDDDSVLDPETMRVHGVEGLRVVDASSMPYVTNGNIYAPVMMLAEKAADLILGQHAAAALGRAVLPLPRRPPADPPSDSRTERHADDQTTASTSETSSTRSDDASPAAAGEGLWKIFGPSADKIIGTPDADLSRKELQEKTGCVAGGQGRLVRRGARRGLRRHGPLRLRQVHAGPAADPADRADRRAPSSSAARTSPAMDDAALRELVARKVSMVFQHFGLLPHRKVRRQRRVRARGARRGQGPAAQPGPGDGRPRRPHGLREQLPRPALRRHAAARRAWPARWPRDPEAADVRRAVLGARPADPARHAERGHPAARGGRQDDGLHHPRPRRRRSSWATGS